MARKSSDLVMAELDAAPIAFRFETSMSLFGVQTHAKWVAASRSAMTI
jgi:hypothetical protein